MNTRMRKLENVLSKEIFTVALINGLSHTYSWEINMKFPTFLPESINRCASLTWS